MSQVYQLAVQWGENKSDLFFEDKETAERTAEFINLMVKNHFLKERKKGKKRKKAGWSAGRCKSARLAHQSKNKNIEQVW